MAGAGQARVLVLAVWTTPSSRCRLRAWRARTSRSCRWWRGHDLTHWHQLRDLGVQRVQRELFESSLHSAHTVLELMGLTAADASVPTQRFARTTSPCRTACTRTTTTAPSWYAAREGRLQLAEQMARNARKTERQAQPTAPPPGQAAQTPSHPPSVAPADGLRLPLQISGKMASSAGAACASSYTLIVLTVLKSTAPHENPVPTPACRPPALA